MKTLRILILEDDLKTLSVINDMLSNLEESLIGSDKPCDIAVTIFSESKQVVDYLNKIDNPDFEIILLDRDSKECGSFHILDRNIFNSEAVICISTNPEYNEELLRDGVRTAIRKNYKNLNDFANRLMVEIKKRLEYILISKDDFEKLVSKAIDVVINAEKCSCGLLVRRLSITRKLAVILYEELENRKIIEKDAPNRPAKIIYKNTIL